MNTDILSDVLRSLRATGTVYFCDQVEPPWTKQYTGESAASFHQIRRGGCWLRSEDVEHYLGPGDIVFLAPGRAHTLSSEPPDRATATLTAGTLLLCGYCQFDETLATPLSELFPDVSIIRDDELQSHAWLRAILDRLSAEFMSRQAGTQIVVNKLTEVLIVELIRMNFGREEQTPLLRALADKHIGKALQCLHANPAQPWTLEMLANEVGLSRAGFAKRFKALVQYSMFDYLTQLRIQRARELLEDSDLPLYEVANRVGYESDLAFTRTFKKRTGVTPTAYRKAKSLAERAAET